jgi:hypothetical protein
LVGLDKPPPPLLPRSGCLGRAWRGCETCLWPPLLDMLGLALFDDDDEGRPRRRVLGARKLGWFAQPVTPSSQEHLRGEG